MPLARGSRYSTLVLVVLCLDGILSALAGALLLPLHAGALPMPVSALASGLLNVALVWAARQVTGSKSLAALPLWVWLVTVGVLALGGPGGDVVFGGAMGYSVLVMLALGALPPAWLLRRMPD